MVFHQVSTLINAIGSPQFPSALLALFSPSAHITSCVVYEWEVGGHPRTIAFAAKTLEQQRLEAIEEYWRKKGYKVDPIISMLNDSHSIMSSVSFVNIPALPRQSKAQSELIANLYEYPGLGEEAIIWSKDKQHVITASFYRQKNSGPFGSAERENIHHLSGIIISCVAKHVELQSLHPGLPQLAGDDQTYPAIPLQNRQLSQIQSVLRNECRELTERELNVCAHTIIGHSRESISLLLDISPNTVATHRRNAYSKLGISTQNQLFGILWKKSAH